MPFETLVALHVTDADGYSAYRDAMTPILARHGGGFRYDFVVAKTLKSEATHPINRVFVIYFPDREAKDAFFENPEYLQICENFFKPSVDGATSIAEFG